MINNVFNIWRQSTGVKRSLLIWCAVIALFILVIQIYSLILVSNAVSYHVALDDTAQTVLNLEVQRFRLLHGLLFAACAGLIALVSIIFGRWERLHSQDIMEIHRVHNEFLQQQRHETERVAAELARVREELVRKTRLAAIGQVSACIAHDLRNPLGTIRNASYLLQHRISKEDARITGPLDIIDQEVIRSNNIITNLMSIARTKSPHKSEVNLKQVIQDIFKNELDSDRIECVIDIVPDPFMIEVDLSQFEQVVSNILHNSVQAIFDTGTFKVRARHSNECDIIEFQDSGPGMDKDMIPQIFEPLITTKVGGTGLGLTICRQIIETHGGSITAENISEQGMLIRICLPYAECVKGESYAKDGL